ncbi:hypothetical protein J31TS4_41890 [Paenibacillus sp. J31TS4]|nr:hypothetical protein J31TS4_41890 [Paenibacillus sp. J31TS4]
MQLIFCFTWNILEEATVLKVRRNVPSSGDRKGSSGLGGGSSVVGAEACSEKYVDERCHVKPSAAHWEFQTKAIGKEMKEGKWK